MSVSRRILLAASLAIPLGGCANWNGIYRTKTVASGGPRVITVDAKQREVLMLPEPDGGRGSGKNGGGWRICAEASPDVFSALAASASGTLKADIAGKSGEISSALAIAETAATIERTQTINLLRESFYRTCERYMSGAISKESFVVQSGRDARAMVAVLAIEQLTGAVRQPATIISGPATAAKAQLANSGLTMLAAAQKRRRDAQADLDAAQEQGAADCDKVDDPARKSDCQAAKAAAPAAAAKAKASIERADTDVADIKQVSGGAGVNSADSSTTAGAIDKGGQNTTGERGSDIQQVSGVVREIALNILQQDDMRLFCIEKYSTFLPDDPIRKACLGLLATAVHAEASKLRVAIDAEVAVEQQVRSGLSDKVRSIPGALYEERMQQLEQLLKLPVCHPPGQPRTPQDRCVEGILNGDLDGVDQRTILDRMTRFDPTRGIT